jgi:hypothetical protein
VRRDFGEEGVRRVSAAGVTLLASFVGVFGVLAGLVMERVLRSWGSLWYEPTTWKIDFYANDLSEANWSGPRQAENPIDAKAMRYELWMDLYNDKEVPTGLRGVSIVFDCESGEVISEPRSLTSGGSDRYRGTAGAVVRIINLAPRQWDFVALYDEIDNPEVVQLLAGWKKVELVGQQRRGLLPGRPGEYRKTIASRESGG